MPRRSIVDLAPGEAAKAVSRAGRVDDAAKALGIPTRAFRAYCATNGISARTAAQAVAIDGDANILQMTQTERSSGEPTSATLLDQLQSVGEDPDAWTALKGRVTAKTTVNASGESSTIAQTQWDLVRRQGLSDILPAQGAHGRPLVFPPCCFSVARREKDDPQLVVQLPDIHAGTTHDPVALALVLEWCSRHQPDKLILSGDQLDYSSISVHAPHPQGVLDSVNLCVQVAFKFLAELRAACPGAEIVWLDGNHDFRLHKLFDASPQFKQFSALCRGGEVAPVLSHRYLFRFDELGIREAVDTYPYGGERIAEGLVAVHGSKTGPGAAKKEIERRNYGKAFGHTHHMSAHFEARWNQDGTVQQVPAFNLGTLAMVERHGMHYAESPDWQQGFGVFRVWPEGDYSWEIAQIMDGKLYCGDDRIVCSAPWDDSYAPPEAYC